MKKAYVAPKSMGYNVGLEAPIAGSLGDVADDLELKMGQSQSDIDDNLSTGANQFTKNNNAWDDKW